MGIFNKLLNQQSSLSEPSQWFTSLLGGSSTYAGKKVTEESAMAYTAVYAAQKVIAETIASLPLPVYQRLEGGGKERAPNHYLYHILHDQANSEMTAFTFKELIQHHILSWGNGWAEIEYDRAGRVRGLWPLNPSHTWMERNQKNKKLEVYTILPDGQAVKLPRERVFHIPGLGDGLVGKSPIRMHQETIGLGKAVEEFGARFFGDGANPGGIVEYPGRMSDEAYERFRKDIREKHSGLGKSHRLMVLEEGLKYHQTGIPPEEAQFLETRKFQLGEIARIYRVPPHMIGDLDRSTNNNIEQQSIEFVVHTIRPWLVRWEQAIKMQLIPLHQKKKYFAEFLVDGLLRGDIKSRYDAYAVGRQNGWLSSNDVRAMENQNPIPNGDVYEVNGNMKPLGSDQGGD